MFYGWGKFFLERNGLKSSQVLQTGTALTSRSSLVRWKKLTSGTSEQTKITAASSEQTVRTENKSKLKLLLQRKIVIFCRLISSSNQVELRKSSMNTGRNMEESKSCSMAKQNHVRTLNPLSGSSTANKEIDNTRKLCNSATWISSFRAKILGIDLNV